jgi:hypothetical protein
MGRAQASTLSTRLWIRQNGSSASRERSPFDSLEPHKARLRSRVYISPCVLSKTWTSCFALNPESTSHSLFAPGSIARAPRRDTCRGRDATHVVARTGCTNHRVCKLKPISCLSTYRSPEGCETLGPSPCPTHALDPNPFNRNFANLLPATPNPINTIVEGWCGTLRVGGWGLGVDW